MSPNAFLLDLTGFDKDMWDRCERMRSLEIPFLVISPNPSQRAQQQGLASGAEEVLVKPLEMKELLALVRSLVPEE